MRLLSHLDRVILIFVFIFYFVHPITFDEVDERRLKKLSKPKTEIVNVSFKSKDSPHLYIKNIFNPFEEGGFLISPEEEITLIFTKGEKTLLEYSYEVGKEDMNMNANVFLIKKDPINPKNNINLKVSVPEDRILLQLSQFNCFGVQIPNNVDLKFARQFPDYKRLEYLKNKVTIETVDQIHQAFKRFLADDGTDIFFGKVSSKYLNVEYSGFFAYNPNNQNIMFFQKDLTKKTSYSLHSYANFSIDRSNELDMSNELIEL